MVKWNIPEWLLQPRLSSSSRDQHCPTLERGRWSEMAMILCDAVWACSTQELAPFLSVGQGIFPELEGNCTCAR